MFRGTWSRSFAMLALLAALLYVGISLYLPSSRRLIFGVDKRSGRVRLVESHVTFLPPHQFYRLAFDRRDGYAQRDGFIRIESQEKIPVTVAYRLRFGVAGDRIPDAATLVSQGWSGWIGRRVAEAVEAVVEHVSIEELLAPNSRFNTQRDPLRRTVAAYLAKSGLKVTAFEIARIEADRDAMLRAKRSELRRAARGIAGRVAVFAIDGADWELLSELSDDGVIPNLRALAHGGVTGSVQTIQPTVSPMLWTTVATGLTPDRHGVIDFTDHARNAPVDGYSRHAPALWDIAEGFGRHAMVVDWWTAWPPTSAETFTFDMPVALDADAVSPAKYLDQARRLAVPIESIGYEQVHRFLQGLSPAEYQQAVNSNTPRSPINVFRGVLAKTWTDHRVAINVWREQQPLLLMMSYEGTDAVNHLFAAYHPPYRDAVNSQDYRRYWSAVTNYYAEIDRLIGEWMSILPSDTTVIVMSAHGFRWGKDRPESQPQGVSALSDHRNPGMVIVYGNHVASSTGTHSMSVYDLAPTVLAILGLPPSADMPGHVAGWALHDIAPVKSVRVISYSEFLNLRPLPAGTNIAPKVYEAGLQAVGHLSDPSHSAPILEGDQEPPTPASLSPDRWGRYAYYNNLGVELRRGGKVKEAVEAFQQAVELNPTRPTPYLNLAMALIDLQQYSNADEAFMAAVEKGLPNADRWFIDYAAFYGEHDMGTRAIAILYKGKQRFPESYEIAANLGSALSAASRYAEGLPELERALGLQPASTLALNNIGIFYAEKKDYARALDFWNRSLAIDPRQPQIRAAAESARTRL